MKVFETICNRIQNKIIDYEEPVQEYGSYVVDDSNFIPMSEAVSQLQNSGGSELTSGLTYDFADGKDNGMKVPLGRRTGMKDLAEVSQEVANMQKDITEKAQTIAKQRQKEAAFEAALANAKGSAPSEPSK